MDSKLLKISMALCLCSCMSACDEGKHGGLECDVATYESECLSANSYMSCVEGVLTTVNCGMDRFCKRSVTTGEDGKESVSVTCELVDSTQKPECETNDDCKDPSKPVCSEDGVCVADTTPEPECETNDDCKDPSKPVCSEDGVCVADTTPEPECETNADCKDPSKPVCSEDGVCVADTPGTVDPCKDVTCEEGTCDLGVCVTEAMKSVKEGDSCDGAFPEFCRGDEMVYCLSDGTVGVSDCGALGGCTMVREEYEGEEYLTSWCRGPAEQCTAVAQEISYCAEDEYGAYESFYSCQINTEGTYTAVDMFLYGEYEICEDSCNASGTHCGYAVCDKLGATKTVCSESWLGDYETVTYSCVEKNDGLYWIADEDSAVSCPLGCTEPDAEGSSACLPLTDGDKCSSGALEFCKDNEFDLCAVFVEEGEDSVVCYTSSSVCEEDGAESYMCSEDTETTLKCTVAKDGTTKVNLGVSEKYCAAGCEAERCGEVDNGDGTCTAKAAEKCAETVKGGMCALFGGEVVCYTDGNVCTTEGDVVKACDGSWAMFGFYGLSTYKCSAADDGETKIYVEDEEAYEVCDEICDPGDEGGTPACVADEVVEGECSLGNQIDCEYYYGFKGCVLIGGEPMCHDGACTTKDEVSNKSCQPYEDMYYESYNTCIEADNGSLVLEYSEADCATVCNADETACE